MPETPATVPAVPDPCFNAPATVLWQANGTDLRGQIADETLGNGLETSRDFDSVTGWVATIKTGPGGTTSIQDLAYQFDKEGHLTQRQDVRQSLTETFTYDNLYRLDFSKLNGVTNLDMTYNQLGNITNKSDLGAYTYNATKIHAVNTIAGGSAVTYDNNGSATSTPGFPTMSWYNSGMSKQISTGTGYSSAFYYGPDGNRFKQVATYPTGSATTIYVGGFMEAVTDAGVTNWRHYIAGPSGPIAVYIRKSSGTPAAMAYYLTKDHLGSVDSITDSSGAIKVRLSYNAFGERRKEAGWVDANLPTADWTAIYAITHRGYTFHEMLDDLGLTHMNGRVYDQISARFISGDPLIDGSGNTQGFNRYSYVMNSPLSYTDPTGRNSYGPYLCVDACDDNGNGDIQEVIVEGHPDGSSGGGMGGLSSGGVSGSATGGGAGAEQDMETVTVTGHKPPPAPRVLTIFLNYLPGLMEMVNSSGSNQTKGDQKSHDQKPKCGKVAEGQLTVGADAAFFKHGRNWSAGPGWNTANQWFWRGTAGKQTSGWGAKLTAGVSGSVSLSTSVLPTGMVENWVPTGTTWEMQGAFLLGGGFVVGRSPDGSSVTFSLKPSVGFAAYVGEGETTDSTIAREPTSCKP